MFFKRRISQKGFSLTEVMIASGIMGVISVGMISLQKSGVMGQKTLLAQDDARVLTEGIASMLSNATACTNSFAGKKPYSTTAADYIFSTSGAAVFKDSAGTTRFSINEVYGNKTLKLISVAIGGGSGTDAKSGIQKWTGPTTAAAGSGTALVVLEWEQTGTTSNQGVGPKRLYRYFLVNATVDATGAITASTSCNTLTGTAASSGSGSQNFLAKWTSSSALGDSVIYQDATTGNIGIGSNTPGVKLDVAGVGRFISPNSGTTGGVVIRDATSNPNASYLQFTNNASTVEYGYIKGLSSGGLALMGGNVGVGTTSPDQRLVVSDGGAPKLKMTPNSGAYGYGIDVESTVGGWAREFSFSYAGSKLGSFGALATDGTMSYLYFNSNQGGTATGHAAPELIINAAGNVAIGTTTAATDTAGTGAAVLTVNNAGSTQLAVQKSNTTGLLINASNTTAGDFALYDKVGGTNNLSIASQGSSISIGTTSRQAKLLVPGISKLGAPDSALVIQGNAGSYVALQGENPASSSTKRGLALNPSGGNVSIGTAPNGSYTLYVQGNGFFTSGYSSSDRNLKNIIGKIPNACEKIEKLSGYYFKWKKEKDQSRQIGLIAQELEEVFPELVKTGSDGSKAVNYSAFSAVLLEAAKELNQRSHSQAGQLKELQERANDQSILLKNLSSETKELTKITLPIEGDLNKLKDETNFLKAEAPGIKKTMDLVQTQLKHQAGTASTFKNTADALRKAADFLTDLLSGLKGSVSKMEKELKIFGKSFSEMHSQVESLEAASVNKTKEIASLRDSIAAAKNRNKALEQENKALKEQNAAIRSYLCQKDAKAKICK